jgi:hypothetical protein
MTLHSFLEAVRQTSPERRDQVIERMDLAIVARGEGAAFPLSQPVQTNAKNFVERSDEIDLLMVTNLLNEEAAKRAGARYAAEMNLGGEEWVEDTDTSVEHHR